MNSKIKTLLIPAALVLVGIVVNGIVVNSVFDPVGLLARKKKRLQQTPEMIESIRGMRQLITAEYLGEVISSLQREEMEKMMGDTVALEKFKRSRVFKKSQLIAVGRGRARAGIDFSTFTEKNFRYLPEKKSIYLYGVTPEILYCDINPWFIPEKKIKGFEIIAATREANNTDDLLLVKSGCLRRLRKQAVANGIVDHARGNAEETLREYFSILMGVRVEKVIIMNLSILPPH
jgi:hypothetical protein